MSQDCVVEPDIDAFCIDNNLDEEASTELRDLEPSLAREVIERGPLTDVRNPNAVVLSRIRQLKGRSRGQMAPGVSPGSKIEGEMVQFIIDNNLDERAETCLRESDEDILTELFHRGPLTDARNASAVVLSRIRDIRRDLAKGATRRERDYDGKGGKTRLERDTARFVRENSLDERAETCLKESSEDILRELFARGPLTDARNPSAVALARIREIQLDFKNNGGPRRHRDVESWKGKGKGGKDDWWGWYESPWDWWGKGKGWGKGDWDWWGKGKGGKGEGKGRSRPY